MSHISSIAFDKDARVKITLCKRPEVTTSETPNWRKVYSFRLMENETLKKELYDTKNGIFFVAFCEYTGLHWHHMAVIVLMDNKIVEPPRQRSSTLDGSLAWPCYDATLARDLAKFTQKYPQLPVFMSAEIKTVKDFYSECPCNLMREHNINKFLDQHGEKLQWWRD